MSTTRKLRIKGINTPKGDTQVDPFSGYLTDLRYLNPASGIYLLLDNSKDKEKLVVALS